MLFSVMIKGFVKWCSPEHPYIQLWETAPLPCLWDQKMPLNSSLVAKVEKVHVTKAHTLTRGSTSSFAETPSHNAPLQRLHMLISLERS